LYPTSIFDHAKGVKDLLKAGVDCWMSAGTAEALGVFGHHRHCLLLPDDTATLGNGWTVKPFDLQHDASEPLGFLIGHKDERLLFVPDTAYVENRFAGVTLAAIECNHVESILSQNIVSGRVDPSLGKRIRRNHMSLETAIAMLKANDLSKCRKIFLLHLSDANSDEQRMKLEIQQATGIPTEIC